jgi:hypothetical protein
MQGSHAFGASVPAVGGRSVFFCSGRVEFVGKMTMFEYSGIVPTQTAGRM